MRAFLVRHGEAERADVDPDRRLTARGVEDVTRIATDAVDQLDVRPRRIVHSDKARARQTAEIWAGLVGTRVAESDGLSPNDDPAIWSARLEGESEDLMLVGHLPHLERLAGLLVASDADQAVVGFPAGGLVVLDRSEDGWDVVVTRA
jgi:phosphohistidine phosphatase